MAKSVKKVIKTKDVTPVGKEMAKPAITEVEKPKVVEAKTVEMKKEDTKVASKKAVEKKVEPKKAEKKVELKIEEPKKVEKKVVEAKKEVKKIASKPEPKKIVTAKEPKKIAAKKEPSKIASKPEPLKIEEVKTVVKKVEAKEKAVKKPATKNAEPKKAVVKTEAKKVETPEKKKVVKKVEKKQVDQEKLDYYTSLSLEECISLVQAMNVHYSYDDYYNLLLEEADLALLERNIIEGNHIKELNLNYKEHGYDEELILITLQKVAETMDIKAVEYKELKKSIKVALKFKKSEDGEVNAAQYLDEFKLSEKLLMIGQRKGIVTVEEEGTLLDADVKAYFQHFFHFAYAILPQWQYSDIKFYEDFAYAVLSQFADLYESEQLRIQMDIADLYVLHGDYAHGDELYGYILRDNQIKDYIYYRYASVYKEIDFNKAKSIAYSSLQYVDDRFTYYTNIMELING